MSRAPMYLQPLQIYLLHKINARSPIAIEKIEVGYLDVLENGCNWDILTMRPQLTRDLMVMIDRDVIAPARATITLTAPRGADRAALANQETEHRL